MFSSIFNAKKIWIFIQLRRNFKFWSFSYSHSIEYRLHFSKIKVSIKKWKFRKIKYVIIIIIIYLLSYSFRVFHISISWWFFHWSLSDSKSPQVSRTPCNTLAVLSNTIIWIVSTRPPTSKSSRPFNNLLVIVQKAPITIGKIVTFMFHSFFSSLAMSRYLSFFSHSYRFILWSAGTAKSIILQILFFLEIIIRSGLLAEIRWSVCMSTSRVSHFLWQLLGCA